MDKCDFVGVFQVNWILIKTYFGSKYTPNMDHFKGRVIDLGSDKWFVPKFLSFQYGDLDEESNSTIIKKVISTLKTRNLYDQYLKSKTKDDTLSIGYSIGKKDKDKEKDKEKEKDELLREKSPEKIRHGEFKNVLLSEVDLINLGNFYGATRAKELIEETSRYFEKKGCAGKYKNHYLCIRDWHKEALVPGSEAAKAQEKKPLSDHQKAINAQVEMLAKKIRRA